MISTKTFKEISDLINLKKLTGVAKFEQLNNGKSADNVDLTGISVKSLNVALKNLNKHHKINLKKYLKGLDTIFMISYISVYLKFVIIKMIEDKKIKDLTVAELIGNYKTVLEYWQETINAIDEKRNELNKQREGAVEQYKVMAEEYKMMMKVIKKVKPNVKDEDIVNEELFFSDSAMDKLLTDIKEKISSTDALKKLFDRYPDELFEATKLRDQVEWLDDNKLLKNKSDNLQGSTHSSIKVLLKQKFIERIEKDGKTYYKKRQP